MVYESQELLRARPQPDGLAGESARRQSQLVQRERAEPSQVLRFIPRGSVDDSILRFITCGSVDDGKSTLIGRMLKDLDLVPEAT